MVKRFRMGGEKKKEGKNHTDSRKRKDGGNLIGKKKAKENATQGKEKLDGFQVTPA